METDRSKLKGALECHLRAAAAAVKRRQRLPRAAANGKPDLGKDELDIDAQSNLVIIPPLGRLSCTCSGRVYLRQIPKGSRSDSNRAQSVQ